MLDTLWMGWGVWTPCVGTEVFCVPYGAKMCWVAGGIGWVCWVLSRRTGVFLISSEGAGVLWVPCGGTGVCLILC